MINAVLGLLFLLNGVALVLSIFLHWSLPLLLVISYTTATVSFARIYHRASRERKINLKVRLNRGLLAGVVGVGAYDLIRYLIVTIFKMDFWPFETFVHFGHLLVSEQSGRSVALLAGTLFHLSNGVIFALSYSLLFFGKNAICGVVWGLGLEVLMFSVYPSWLDLSLVMKEFTIVSVSGHIAYGLCIGFICKQKEKVG